ncbi:MAG TPA: hypothetical protein VJ810_28775 [Blastocatellia bacterium]|nr:hypothetical protein [Blastocatellia bacterium]
MKYLSNTIILATAISVLTFQVQAQPATPKDAQRKKTTPEKSATSTLPAEKEKRDKLEEIGKPDATEASSPVPRTSAEKLATAVALALSIGRQADIDDPVDKIKVMLESAKLLVRVSPIDCQYLVAEAAELLLERKKKEQSENEQSRIAEIEREVVVLYSKIDPEKTERFIKESLDVATENTRKSHTNDGSLAAKEHAEKMAKLATALIDGGVPAGVDLLLNSVAETGRVANAFSRPFRTALSVSELRERMSARIKQVFSGKIVAEPNELSILAIPLIAYTGKDDTYSIINAAILELEINSLKHIETTLRSAREREKPVPYANEALDQLCGRFASSLRDLYARWLPDRLKDVDLCLKGIQESVSFKIGELWDWEKAKTFEEKLDKASGMTDGSRRERELINLAFDVLNNRVSDQRYSRSYMVDKILIALNSNDSRELVKDANVIAGIKDLVKEKNFVQVAQEARRISRSDWRAQALVGAASGLDKTDQEAAKLLYLEALGILNSARPGTAVIRTTLFIAERYYEKEPAMGRQLLNSAVRFANQTNFSEKGFRFPFDRSLFASIGSVVIALGFEPERIYDALRDFNFGKIAQSDWQTLYTTSHNIGNKMLRATFQLKMCEAVINQSSQAARKVE